MECLPQSSCVAVAVSNFFSPKGRTLFFIERPDLPQLHQLRRPHLIVGVSERALEPSLGCSCTAASCTAVGIEPWCRLLADSTTHCHCRTMPIKQSSNHLVVQLDQLVDGLVVQSGEVTMHRAQMWGMGVFLVTRPSQGDGATTSPIWNLARVGTQC